MRKKVLIATIIALCVVALAYRSSGMLAGTGSTQPSANAAGSNARWRFIAMLSDRLAATLVGRHASAAEQLAEHAPKTAATPTTALHVAGTGKPLTATQPLTLLANEKPASTDAPSAHVTDREEEVLEMYGDMADVFDRNREDCTQLASKLKELVSTSEPALRRLADERATLSEAERLAADQRLEQAAGPQLEGLRQSLRSAMARCAGEPRLQQQLIRVAQLGQRS